MIKDKELRKNLILSSMLHALPAIIIALLSLLGGSGDGEKESKTAKEEQMEVDIIPPKAEEEVVVVEESAIEKLKKIAPHAGDDCDYFYGGIGIVQGFSSKTGEFTIQEVYPGYPASRAGIQAGDEIISTEEIRGEIGTPITVRVRSNGHVISYDLIRDKICTSKPRNKGENP